MKRKLLPFSAIICLLFSVFQLTAQDIHFSQYGTSPLNLSPGLTGGFACDMRFAASYRNQWKAVAVPYSTFSGSVENKFYHKKGKYDRFFTGGFLFDYDRQGLLRLTSLLVGLNGSLTLPVVPNHFLTLGLHGSYNGRHFDDNKLEVDNQWNGKNFEPGLSLGETIDNEKIGFVDFGAGANWRWNNASRRAKIDVGAGLFSYRSA